MAPNSGSTPRTQQYGKKVLNLALSHSLLFPTAIPISSKRQQSRLSIPELGASPQCSVSSSVPLPSSTLLRIRSPSHSPKPQTQKTYGSFDPYLRDPLPFFPSPPLYPTPPQPPPAPRLFAISSLSLEDPPLLALPPPLFPFANLDPHVTSPSHASPLPPPLPASGRGLSEEPRRPGAGAPFIQGERGRVGYPEADITEVKETYTARFQRRVCTPAGTQRRIVLLPPAPSGTQIHASIIHARAPGIPRTTTIRLILSASLFPVVPTRTVTGLPTPTRDCNTALNGTYAREEREGWSIRCLYGPTPLRWELRTGDQHIGTGLVEVPAGQWVWRDAILRNAVREAQVVMRWEGERKIAEVRRNGDVLISAVMDSNTMAGRELGLEETRRVEDGGNENEREMLRELVGRRRVRFADKEAKRVRREDGEQGNKRKKRLRSPPQIIRRDTNFIVSDKDNRDIENSGDFDNTWIIGIQNSIQSSRRDKTNGESRPSLLTQSLHRCRISSGSLPMDNDSKNTNQEARGDKGGSVAVEEGSVPTVLPPRRSRTLNGPLERRRPYFSTTPIPELRVPRRSDPILGIFEDEWVPGDAGREKNCGWGGEAVGDDLADRRRTPTEEDEDERSSNLGATPDPHDRTDSGYASLDPPPSTILARLGDLITWGRTIYYG